MGKMISGYVENLDLHFLHIGFLLSEFHQSKLWKGSSCHQKVCVIRLAQFIGDFVKLTEKPCSTMFHSFPASRTGGKNVAAEWVKIFSVQKCFWFKHILFAHNSTKGIGRSKKCFYQSSTIFKWWTRYSC